jgi:hypothetical protein
MNDLQTDEFTLLSHAQILERAADVTGTYQALTQLTGISRRRIGYIKAGSPMSVAELHAMQMVIVGEL